jgi:hypothetical protein
MMCHENGPRDCIHKIVFYLKLKNEANKLES